MKDTKKRITLIDGNFVGRNVVDIPGVNFSWWPEEQVVSNNVFFTDYCLHRVEEQRDSNVKKNAWLIEPRVIIPQIYTYIEENYKKFDVIITFDSDILSKCNNSVYAPYGTFWVEKSSCIKDKNVSFISSNKRFAPGHNLRHTIHERFKTYIDTFGTITGSRLPNKNIALDNYKFSIAVENSIQEGYFTEKVLDCFATKTIPIYWGDITALGKFFNLKGVIHFTSLDELEGILSNCSEELYLSLLDVIEENYSKVDNLKEPEMYIERNYSHILS